MGKTFNQQTISSVPSCSFDNRLIDLNLQINLYCRTKHLKKCQAVSMTYLKDWFAFTFIERQFQFHSGIKFS